ncbi:transposase [Bradyrhizobium valentinum]
MSKVARLDVISSGARRRWTLEEKQRIVAESYAALRQVSATARRNGLSASQLFTWRRQARDGRLVEADEVVRFDLPLNFHPAAIRVSVGFTPSGTGGATWDRRSKLGGNVTGYDMGAFVFGPLAQFQSLSPSANRRYGSSELLADCAKITSA